MGILPKNLPRPQPFRKAADSIGGNFDVGLKPMSALPSVGSMEADDERRRQQAEYNAELWGMNKGLSPQAMPSSSTGVRGIPQTAPTLSTRPVEGLLQQGGRRQANDERARRVNEFESEYEPGASESRLTKIVKAVVPAALSVVGLGGAYVVQSPRTQARIGEAFVGGEKALPGGEILNSLALSKDERETMDALSQTGAGKVGGLSGTLVSFGAAGKLLKFAKIPEVLQAPLQFGGVQFAQSAGHAVGEIKDINAAEQSGTMKPDQADDARMSVYKRVAAESVGGALTAILGPLTRVGQIAAGALGRAVGGATAGVAGEVATNALQGETTDLSTLGPTALMFGAGEGLGAFGGHEGTRVQNEKLAEYESARQSIDNLTGGNDATQTGEITENNQQQYQGTPQGAAPSENGTEIRPEESQQNRRSDSVGQIPPEEVNDRLSANLPLESTVIPGDGIQTGPIGRPDAGDHGAQPPGVDAGIPPDAENRQNDTDRFGTRGPDRQSDHGDESLRSQEAQGNEGVPPEGATGDREVRPSSANRTGERVSVLQTEDGDFVYPKGSETHQGEILEHRTTDSGVDLYKVAHPDGGYSWETNESIRSTEEPTTEPEKQLSDRQLYIKHWGEVKSNAPMSPREYILRDIESAGRKGGIKLSQEDAEQAIFGKRMSAAEKRRNYLGKVSKGMLGERSAFRFDDYIAQAMSDFYGDMGMGEANARTTSDRTTEWERELHDIIGSVGSSKEARDLLVSEYRKSLPDHTVNGEVEYSKTNAAENEDSFNFGANAESKTEPPESNAADGSEAPYEPNFTRPDEPVESTVYNEQGELNPLPPNVTGLRKSIVDAERQKRGQPPIEDPISKPFAASWDEGADKKAANPNAPEMLAKEIAEKPRALDDVDAAMLLQHRIGLRNAMDQVQEAIGKAKILGDEKGRLNAQAAWEVANDNLSKFEEQTRPSFTKTARGLAALRMLADDEYSLHSMRERAQVFSPDAWTPEKEEALRNAHAEIENLRGEIAKREADRAEAFDQSKAEQHYRNFLREMKTEMGAAKKGGVREYFKNKKEEDLAWVNRYTSELHAGINPEYVLRLSRLAINDILEFGDKFEAWADRMKDRMGDLWEKAKPYFAEAWSKAQDQMKVMGESDLANARSGARDTGSLTGKQVFDLMRAHFNSGTEDMHELLSKVTGDLQVAHPGISEREVRDLFSGYGEVRYPSEKRDLVKLAEYKELSRYISKNEDVVIGERAKASGLRRDKPTEDVAVARKDFNERLKKSGLDEIDWQNPDSKYLATALGTAKRRTQKLTNETNARIQSGNYTKAAREPLKPDAELELLRRDLIRARTKFDQGVEANRLKNRTKWQKRWDVLPKWARFNVLSYPTVFPKLILTALGERGLLFAPEEAVGAVLAHIPRFREVSAQAPVEGGFSQQAFMRSYEGLFGKEGLGDALLKAKGKLTDLEMASPDARKREVMEWMGYVGFMHGVWKASPRRSLYNYAIQKMREHYTSLGQNPDEPALNARMKDYANTYSEMAQFTQRNRVSKYWSMSKAWARNQNNMVGRGLERSMNIALPISTVGGNIVKSGAVRLFGWPDAVIRMMAKGVHGLPPEEADLIMRHLKKGWVGPGLLMLGMLNPSAFGGLIHGRHKDGELEANDIEGLPPWFAHALSHFPPVMIVQLGATLTRAYQASMDKGDNVPTAITNSLAAGGLGIVQNVPLVGLVGAIGTAVSSPGGMIRYAESVAKMLAEPGIVQQTAKWVDPEEDRIAHGFTEKLQKGIPFLRNELDVRE